jgi:hypothetical protein
MMKKVRYWAIGSLAPLGLLIGACYQSPTQMDDVDPAELSPAAIEEPVDPSESADPGADQGEPVDEDCQALEDVADAVACRRTGVWCRNSGDCCSRDCRAGVCRGGGGAQCRWHAGYCNSNWDCCSFNCYGNKCHTHRGAGGECHMGGEPCHSDGECCVGGCGNGRCSGRRR